jgi:HK97 family phage major capsid protein
MVQAFAEELTFTLEDEIFRADGAGKCLGILNSPALITVAAEGGQSADTLLLANLVKMWSRCWGRSRKNAVWFISQDIEPQLFTLSQVAGSQGFPRAPAAGASR